MSKNADYPLAPSDLPFISAEQMRVVDELIIDDFGVGLLQMMENAGRNLADLAVKRFLNDHPLGKRVIVLAGPGGNGGGGLAAAQHLHNAGAEAEIVLAAPRSNLSTAAAAQLKICQASEIGITEFGKGPLSHSDFIVDAVLGYGILGDPRGAAAGVIDAASSHPAPVLSNDIPSGVDATSGFGRASVDSSRHNINHRDAEIGAKESALVGWVAICQRYLRSTGAVCKGWRGCRRG